MPSPCVLSKYLVAAALALVAVSARCPTALATPSADRIDDVHPVRVFYRAEGDAAAPCLSHARIQAAIGRALRRKVFVSAGESDVSVVLRQVGKFGAEVSLFDAQAEPLGSRALKAKDCAELSELVVFTLTVMVDFRSDEVGRKREEAAQARRDAEASAASTGGGGETLAVDATATTARAGGDPTATTSAKPAAKDAPELVDAATSNDGARRDGSRSEAALGAVTPGVGALLETGSTPQPLIGLYGQLMFSIAAPLVLAVSARGERMLEVPRAGGELRAWRAALVAEVCWVRGGLDEWRFGLCLGVTPSMTWVSATGLGADRTTSVGGVGIEPTFGLWAPLGDAVAHVSVGGALPLLRNDWHARRPGGDLPLFRAEAVGLLVTTGVLFGR